MAAVRTIKTRAWSPARTQVEEKGRYQKEVEAQNWFAGPMVSPQWSQAESNE